VGEVGADGGEVGIAAVDGVAGEDGVVAEILQPGAAKPAIAVDAADPGDADARADGERGGSTLDHLADDLMAGNDARLQRLEIAFDDVEIGAADAAGEDFEQDFAGLWLRARDVFEPEPGTGSG
jgi:hypothetical protein